jgi:hypothetical protein
MATHVSTFETRQHDQISIGPTLRKPQRCALRKPQRCALGIMVDVKSLDPGRCQIPGNPAIDFRPVSHEVLILKDGRPVLPFEGWCDKPRHHLNIS